MLVQVVYCPKEEAAKKKKEVYPEREGFRKYHREWCRAIRPLDEMMEDMEREANVQLRSEGHTEVIKEELIGGRLYTGYAAAAGGGKGVGRGGSLCEAWPPAVHVAALFDARPLISPSHPALLSPQQADVRQVQRGAPLEIEGSVPDGADAPADRG